MDTDQLTVSRLATELGVAPSTLYRRLVRQPLTATRADQLRKLFGVVPAVPGYSRRELLILATISRSPLGLRSVRAIARRTSLSPTTVSRALPRLLRNALVTCVRRQFVEGRIVEGDLWSLNHASAKWHEIAAAVGRVSLPEVAPAPIAHHVPARFGHHFWTGSLSTLDLDSDGPYIASRLVLSDDPQAIAWAAANLSAGSLRRCARSRGLAPSQRSLLLGMAVDAARYNKSRGTRDAIGG